MVKFSELADDARKYTTANNEGAQSDCYRIEKLRAEFGERPADSIPIENFRNWFDEQDWEPETHNRMRTVLFSVYRLGIENGKVEANSAAKLKRKKVPDGRVRFLNEKDEMEEKKLRAVIEANWPEHIDEFIIALNTGMRRGEQYRRIDWSSVDLVRKDLCVP